MTQKTKTSLLRVGAVAAFFVMLFVLMSSLSSVTTMLMIALAIAYVLNPLVIRFSRWGIGRTVSAFLFLFLGLLVTVLFVLVFVPILFNEIGKFVALAPKYWATLQGLLVQAATKLNVEIPQDWAAVMQMLPGHVQQILPNIADYSARIVKSLFQSTLQLFSTVFYTLMIPVIAFYLMVSFEEMREAAKDLIPPYARETIVGKLREIDAVVAAFIRGQVTVACLLGIFYAIGFFLVGIDLPVVLGLLCGIMAIVPYVGSFSALVLGSIMTVAKYGDFLHLAGLLGWIVVVQLFEGYVLTPKIVGHAVGLHPVVYILALIAAGNLFGFVGMLIAIPVTAALKVLLVSGIKAYRNSSLYNDPPAEEM